MDDLARARGKRIAQQLSTDKIREALRSAKELCPACQQPLRTHTNTMLTLCALALDDESPRGA